MCFDNTFKSISDCCCSKKEMEKEMEKIYELQIDLNYTSYFCCLLLLSLTAQLTLAEVTLTNTISCLSSTLKITDNTEYLVQILQS